MAFFMRQLPLQITQDFIPDLDNFVAGRNVELLHALNATAAGKLAERFFYLWGDTGVGKSHLLRGAVAAARRAGLRAGYFVAGASLAETADYDFVAVDEVTQLDGAAQIALFNRYNQLKDEGGRLLAAGPCAPAQLALRADLVTRLGWGLVFQTHGLDDSEKAAALAAHARARGFRLSADVANYLLNRWRRDLPSLVAAVEALDCYSLETQRPVTVPLLREILTARPEQNTSG